MAPEVSVLSPYRIIMALNLKKKNQTKQKKKKKKKKKNQNIKKYDVTIYLHTQGKQENSFTE